MSINSIGGGSDPIDMKRRELAAQRERELDDIEYRYKNETKKIAENKAEHLEKIYNNQSEEIDRAQMESSHKVERAQKAAEDRIRRYNQETEQLTAEAGKKFRAKATQLSQIENEMKFQENQLNQSHKEALKAIEAQKIRTEELSKTKSMRETEALSTHYNDAIVDTRKKGEADLALTQKELTEKKSQTFEQGQADLERIRTQQKRLMEEGQTTEQLEKQRGHEALDMERKQFQAQYDKQVQSNIQNLTGLRDQYNKAATKLKNDSEFKEQKTKSFYYNSMYDLEKENEKKINAGREKANFTLNQVTKEEANQKARLEKMHYKYLQDLQQQQQKMVTEAELHNETMKEKINEDYIKQGQILREKRAKTLSNIETESNTEIRNIQNLGSRQIEQTKLDTSRNIIEYSTKTSDPFYKIQKFNAQLSENEQGVYVFLSIPAHEQENIRVTMNKGSLTLAGNRRFEGQTQSDQNHKIATHSYQSYSETLPLNGQFDARRMVRSYENGVLKFFIPKI